MNHTRFWHLFVWASWTDGVWTLIWKRWYLSVKAPWAFTYFSERNGYQKPLVKIFGWRVFMGKSGK